MVVSRVASRHTRVRACRLVPFPCLCPRHLVCPSLALSLCLKAAYRTCSRLPSCAYFVATDQGGLFCPILCHVPQSPVSRIACSCDRLAFHCLVAVTEFHVLKRLLVP